MLHPSHRGIYEFLWSDHKYSVIAFSLKAYQNMGSRFGRRPQILNWLHKLAVFANSEKLESYNGLLNAYLYVKEKLSRADQEEIIELILENEQNASDLIYQHVINQKEKALYSCRLFFNQNKAIFKFWDVQYRPGLWLCFGPFQLHLTPDQVINRISILTDISKKEISERLRQLEHGISSREFKEWPELLCNQLVDNNLVAEPGLSAILNPRVNISDFCWQSEVQKLELEQDLVTALTLENLYDSRIGENSCIGRLPEEAEFYSAYTLDNLPYVKWQNDFLPEEGFIFLSDQFWRQKQAESGIGVEPTNKEVDPEESEHSHQKADY